MMPCEVLSLLPSRLSCLTSRSCLYRMQMEHMTRRSCRRDGAARQDTLSLLPSRRRCPTRRNCVNRMPMERMVRRSCPTRRRCPTRQSCPTRMGSVVRPAYNQSGGVRFSKPYEEVDVVGQRKPLAFTPVTLLGQVSP